ncbi:MAG: hypothetical protein NTV46_05190 [Verrucomicrobia bacterium]|nr:hypothetical protein [Verrucomicrobiota bacterium]
MKNIPVPHVCETSHAYEMALVTVRETYRTSDLCHVLEHPTPAAAYPTGANFCF